jgi:hypothetical protein
MGNKIGILRKYASSNMAYCKIHLKIVGSEASSAIHVPLGLIFYQINKANIISDCLEYQLRAHNLWDCDYRRHVEAQVEALLATVDVNFCPRDASKEIKFLKLVKAYVLDGIPNECLRLVPRRLVYLTRLFDHCLRLGHFLAPRKETKLINLPKLGKDPKFIQDLHGQTIWEADFKNTPKTQ